MAGAVPLRLPGVESSQGVFGRRLACQDAKAWSRLGNGKVALLSKEVRGG